MVCGVSERNLSRKLDGRKLSTAFVDGIKVVQANVPYSNKQSFLFRTVAFLRFAWRAYAAARVEEDVDLVFATSTPLTVSIPGVLAAKYHRAPFVFEVRDLWPELPAAMGVIRNSAILWAMRKLELWAYRRAARIVALAPGIRAGIVHAGYPARQISMIPNCSDTDLFQPGKQERDGELTLVFTGAHGRANGLDAVLDAADEIKRRGEKGVRFLLVGDGSEKTRLAGRAEKLALNDVTFHEPVPKSQLASMLRKADVGLMILKNVPAFYDGTSPNKFFDYLAAGLAVLCNYPGWLASIIEQTRCGIVVPPDDPSAFADAVLLLRDNRDVLEEMGRRARLLAETEFGRDELAERFVDVLESVAVRESTSVAPMTAARAGSPRSAQVPSGQANGSSTAAQGPPHVPSGLAVLRKENLQPSPNALSDVPGKPRASPSRSRVNRLLKRLMDVVGAGTGLVLAGPVMAMTAVLICLLMGQPVLYVSARPGLRGRVFRLFKFRTMTGERGPGGELLPDGERLTTLGRLIRTLSLDELPQLWNVLRAEMSLVGPRPLLPEYLGRYTPTQARRHEVLPGITGWAQVNGRNAITWEQKFALDVWYADHQSLWLDLRILCKTLGIIFKREGIWMRGEINERFMGSFPETISRRNGLQTAMSPPAETEPAEATRSERPWTS
jgi:lipopolysaccharide/colanic/teichoic acid biosynthesis glycosyltransferase/glycosyltransferase involved in cell wall biosynthesis